MTSQPGGLGRRALSGQGLTLDYPMSLGTFEKYDQAQRAVDYLSDHEFPVENCMIVGTELKQVERVTGRLTRGRVAGAGALSGRWMGLFVGLIFSLFGLVWALIGYAATRGQRDFPSVSQVVATRYEVLVEHKFAERARELLAQMPGGGPALTA